MAQEVLEDQHKVDLAKAVGEKRKSMLHVILLLSLAKLVFECWGRLVFGHLTEGVLT